MSLFGKSEERQNPRCSFCHKRQDEVKAMVYGPNVHICEECVAQFAEMLSQPVPRKRPALWLGVISHYAIHLPVC